MRRKLIFVFTVCFVAATVCGAEAQQKKAANSPNPKQPPPKVKLWNPPTMEKPLSNYSHVAEITGGKLVFIAGQVGNDASGQMVSTTDFRSQVEQAFKNIKAAVEAAGGDMSSLVKVNYYVVESVDAAQLPAVREVRDKYISATAPPASTFVVVKRLARPEILVEIEAVAVVEK